MKKLCVLAPLLLASQSFAISDENLVEMLKAQIPQAEISILKREKISNSDFESIEFELRSGDDKTKQVIFSSGDFIFPDIIDTKQQISYRQEFEVRQFEEARMDFQKNVKNELAKEQELILIGDKNKPLIYVFSDPECPYCRAHLKSIEDELKTHQVAFILTSVHGRTAFEKVANIYKESKNVKTDKEKLAILNKYYDENIQTYPKVSEDEYQNAIKLYEKYRSLGLRSVPTIIN